MILFTFNLCWVYIARHIFRLYARKCNSCQYPLMYCNKKIVFISLHFSSVDYLRH